jgi:hypothetical protein
MSDKHAKEFEPALVLCACEPQTTAEQTCCYQNLRPLAAAPLRCPVTTAQALHWSHCIGLDVQYLNIETCLLSVSLDDVHAVPTGIAKELLLICARHQSQSTL